MARRGIIITYYFPPLGGGGVQRWAKFIKYLYHYNWQFDVITRSPTPYENLDQSLLDNLPESLSVININDYALKEKFRFFKNNSNYVQRYLAGFLFPTDSRKSWVIKAWDILEDRVSNNDYDVIICTIPPYTLSDIAVKIKERFSSIPIVLDMRDPWTLNPYKIYPSKIHKLIDRKREQKNICQIDNIISAYHSTFDYFSEKIPVFDKKNKIVLSNGFDNSDFEELTKKEIGIPNCFNIAFSGTFYSHLNNPKYFLKAIIKVKEKINVCFHHIGTSAYDIGKLAHKIGLDENIKLWGYKNHHECLQILNNMDAFVFILDPDTINSDKTIGGKVYEYLRFKKPILAIVPDQGEAADLIKNTDSGIVCGSNNINQIAESILNLKSKQFSYQGLDKYNRKNIANELNTFLLQIINRNQNESSK